MRGCLFVVNSTIRASEWRLRLRHLSDNVVVSSIRRTWTFHDSKDQLTTNKQSKTPLGFCIYNSTKSWDTMYYYRYSNQQRATTNRGIDGGR